MQRGRKKRPENVKPGTQPKAVPGKITAPARLDPEAVVIFNRIAKILEEMKILTAGDLDIVASYAEVASLGYKAKAKVDEHGATQKSRTGFAGYSADYLVWRDCGKAANKILGDLGLTPASRTRVAAAVAEEVDEFAEFMKRKQDRFRTAGSPKPKPKPKP